MDKSKKLTDFRLLVDVHLLLSRNYFEKESYNNSLKCLKFVLVEYFENPKILSAGFVKNNIQVARIHSEISNIQRKLSKFDKSLLYVQSSLDILKGIFGENSKNLNTCIP